MYTEDFVLRMINQAVAALLQLVKLKKAGQYQEARQLIDQALEQLLGLRADLVRALDDRKLVAMLTAHNELDGGRLSLIADLFREEGDISLAQGGAAESRRSYGRALSLYLELALSAPQELTVELIRKIASLERSLGSKVDADPGLGVETQLARLDYYETLLKLDEKKLSASGLTHMQVELSVSRLRHQLAHLLE